jgi:hypothetical protein
LTSRTFVLYLLSSAHLWAQATPQRGDLYRRQEAPLRSRVENLLRRMTVEEKVRQLDFYAGATDLMSSHSDKTHAGPDANFVPARAEALFSNEGVGAIHDLNPTPALSDYVNQHYLPPNMDHLPAMEVDFIKNILRGNKISSVDGRIIAGLVGLMAPGHFRPEVKAARDIRPEDLETNGNLILLGSPRSNPWAAMYDPLVDFRFVFDDQTQREFVRNVRPAAGEKTEYIPTAGGFDTGKSYATISVFQMSGHVGKVLLIAGANGEGTEAAGALITDPSAGNRPCRRVICRREDRSRYNCCCSWARWEVQLTSSQWCRAIN